jgi:hypothetical protein
VDCGVPVAEVFPDVRLRANGAAVLQGVQVSAADAIAVQGSDASVTAAIASEQTRTEHGTHGTEIDRTGWHDLG